MNTNSVEFDSLIDQIDHFKRFPAMKPYIGVNYGKNDKTKILLIAESNYLPEYVTLQKSAEIWYNSEQSDLKKEFENQKSVLINTIVENPIHWINCRGLLDCDWKSPGHMIYRELNNSLKKFYSDSPNRAMSNIAFMNGFQRPALTQGGSIKKHLTQKDLDISRDVISKTISIIKPDLVVYVSKLAWDNLRWKLTNIDPKIRFEFTCHPTTGGLWWNKKGYKHGKQKFLSIISDNGMGNV